MRPRAREAHLHIGQWWHAGAARPRILAQTRKLIQTRKRNCRHNLPLQDRRRVIRACVGFPTDPGLQEEVETMLELASSLRSDPEKPSYHVMPRNGWINDPNGPIYVNGQYHVFYQHIINGCEWDFGIVWGHAASTDLIHWEHLPPALLPSPGGLDADGCFSGCAVLDTDGTPTILYTGVRLRSNPECGPLPPPECDLKLPFIESQCAAVADMADETLATWSKSPEPFLATPPPDMPLVGWRDPYIFEFKGKSGKMEWGMLMGSGLKGKGGAVMIYRSDDLSSGWRYDGMLCEADSLDTGAMWECPLLIQLTTVPEYSRKASQLRSLTDALNNIASFRDQGHFDPKGFKQPNGAVAESAESSAANAPLRAAQEDREVHPGSLRGDAGRPLMNPTDEDTSTSGKDGGEEQQPYTHLLCVSPDAPTNPVLYWLGHFDAEKTKFLLEGAKGPLRLDLGDILYAPNLLVDEDGQHMMWGWLQERRKVGSYDYAGCLSLPRVLYLRGDRLIQEPAPEIAQLRRGDAWHAHHLKLFPEEVTPLEGVAGPAIEIQCTIERGTAAAAGVLVRSWNASGEGSAAIVYDWERCVLEAVFEGDGDFANAAQLPSAEDNQRRVGGEVDLRPGEPLQMRIMLDHSCVEVYLGSGEVLSTRIYRGHPPRGADAGIDFVAYGGTAKVERVEAWELGSIWVRDAMGEESLGKLDVDLFEQATVMGQPVPV